MPALGRHIMFPTSNLHAFAVCEFRSLFEALNALSNASPRIRNLILSQGLGFRARVSVSAVSTFYLVNASLFLHLLLPYLTS